MLEEKVLLELQEYVNGRLERPTLFNCYSSTDIVDRYAANSDFETFDKESRPSFGQVLFAYIEKKGVGEAGIFKRAGMDPGQFLRIRNDPHYQPGKNTVIALAMALELNKIETDRLLSAAGYSLSNCNTFDLVIHFCLENEIFGMEEINQSLHIFGLEPL